MIWYFVQQYRHSQSNIVSEAMKQELIKKSIRNGLVNISGVLCSEIEVCAIPEIMTFSQSHSLQMFQHLCYLKM